MDSESLHLNIDYVGSSGIILSPEQKAALQTSLVLLKSDSKFHKVYFWGKIFGVKDDYFIAQGVSTDEIAERKTLYSKDCCNWGLLPFPTKAMRDQSKLAKGRFTGDPSYEFEHTEMKKVGEGEEATEEEETISIKEEDRLASVIADIDEDVKICPRGAFVKSPTGQVNSNRSFEGLSVSDAAKLCSYMHFRDPVHLHEKTLLQRADMDKSVDFLDTLEEDIPKEKEQSLSVNNGYSVYSIDRIVVALKGSWSLQFERGSALATLRSLLWLGYVAYHVPGTRLYGSVYCGTGEKNMDLPFML